MQIKSWKLLDIFLSLLSLSCFSLLMEKNMFVKQELFIWIYLTKRLVKFTKILFLIKIKAETLRSNPLSISASFLLYWSLKKHTINIQACFLYCTFLFVIYNFSFKHCFSILQINYCYISWRLIIYI